MDDSAIVYLSEVQLYAQKKYTFIGPLDNECVYLFQLVNVSYVYLLRLCLCWNKVEKTLVLNIVLQTLVSNRVVINEMRSGQETIPPSGNNSLL